jgi:hypothetical protein
LPTIANDQLLSALATLIESSNPVVKGKTVIAVLLLLQNNIAWSPLIGIRGIYQHIDKLSKDSYKYLKSCIATLRDTAEKCAADSLTLAADDLTNKLSGKSSSKSPKQIPTSSLESKFENDAFYKAVLKLSSHIAPNSTVQVFNGALILMKLLQDQTQCQVLKPHIITAKSVKTLSELLILNESKEFEVVQFAILQLLESLASSPKILPAYCDVIIQQLLPNLIARIYSKNEELRCSCFKLVCDIMAQFMCDEKYLTDLTVIVFTMPEIQRQQLLRQ